MILRLTILRVQAGASPKGLVSEAPAPFRHNVAAITIQHVIPRVKGETPRMGLINPLGPPFLGEYEGD